MKHISSYLSIYQLGHRSIAAILSSPFVIEEKVDGSQFSMCKTDGELACRSKGVDLIIDAPEKMFSAAIETAKSLDLHDGWTYRCEYLKSPKHNTLAYSRVPAKHLIVFDVMTAPETYLTPDEKRAEAERLGLECVPCFFDGTKTAPAAWAAEGRSISKGWAEELLSKDSILGGCKVEGFVVKNYSMFTPDKKIAVAKFVSEAFKEKHQGEWKSANPGPSDVVQLIAAQLRTNARWEKAMQHLRDDGKLLDDAKDIGPLINEVKADIEKEETQWIKDRLFAHFHQQIIRQTTNGLPEWYKEKLGLGAAALSNN